MTLNPEQIEHINLVNWFHYEYPEYKEDFHHFANERHCSIIQGRILKRMGVKKGVPDFHLAIACGNYHGLWIELKVGKGKLSIEQSEFLYRKNDRGYLAMAVWGSDAAKEIINNYLDSKSTICNIEIPKDLYNTETNC